MHKPEKISLKLFVTSIILTMILSLGAYHWYVSAQSSSTLTIKSGTFQETASYVIWKEGSYYYAKAGDGSIPSWGTGSTNASYVVNTAVDQIASTGGKIFIRSGLYTMSSPIDLSGTYSVALEGEANRYSWQQGTVLNFNANMSAGIIKNETSLAYYGITIKHLTIDGNNKDLIGIYFKNVRRYTIEDVVIYNTGQQGIYLQTCEVGWIEKVRIYGAGQEGLKIASSPSVRVNDCDFGNNDGVGLWSNTEDLKVYGTNSYLNYMGFYIGSSGTGTQLVGVGAWHNDREGIFLTTVEGVSIIGGIVYNNGQNLTNEYDGIRLYNTFNCTVQGVRVYDDQSPKTQKYGIGESGTSDYNVIIGNVVVGAGNTANVGVVGSNTIVHHNIGFITENSGSFSSAANGTYVAHGLAGTPDVVTVTLSVQGYAWVPTSSINSTHFQVYANVDPISGYWYAEYKP